MAGIVKVQAFTLPSGIVDVILDLVAGDHLIAQITLDLVPVTCMDSVGEHDRQSAIFDALQGAGT